MDRVLSYEKLSSVNQSIILYNVNRDWPEVAAQKGANEIASCLMDYIQIRAAHGTKIFELFSDNCSGQNRNVFCSCAVRTGLL